MKTHHLPVALTPFVGRTHDLRAIMDLVANPSCRLLTLVGPGGMGKTRLSQEVLRQLADKESSDGLYFIGLQALNATSLIIPAIADAIGLTFFQTANQQQELLDFLRPKRLFIVFDNMEHLLGGVEIISAILAHAPEIRVLVTSRESLNLQEEWLYSLTGMGIPNTDAMETLESFSAVRLFVQTARRVYPDFSVENERAGIARICALVGGMPLGLELAAAWVRALSCDEIADEIANNLSILETSARNVPERHRTMRGVLAQSWTLLTNEEQQVMIRLAVFQGGCTREAAEVVAGASLRVLSGLVDKSWLRWDSDNRRYDLHELLRQYAEEQLIAAGQLDTARNAHAAFFARWMQKREGEIKFRRQDEALDDIECDFANVRLAWQWATDTADADLINPMIEALNFYGDMRARFTEALELFDRTSQRFAPFDDHKNKLTYYRLRLRRSRMFQNAQTYIADDLDNLIAELEDIRQSLTDFDCPMETALAIYQIGFAKSFRTIDEVGISYFSDCVRIYAQVGDKFYEADALHLLATSINDFQKAKEYYEAAFRIQEDIGDRNGIGWSLTQLARSNYVEHCFDIADDYSVRARAIQRERHDWKGLHYSLINYATWAFLRGKGADAVAAAEESLEVAITMRMLTPERASRATLGLILVATETDVERGQDLCLKVLSTFLPLVSSITEAEFDAFNGLAIAAYLRADMTALCDYHQQVSLHVGTTWITQNKYNLLVNLATSGILVLDAQNHTVLAVELTALVIQIPDLAGLPAIAWLEKWPLLNRLRSRWQVKLGAEAFADAWERGKTRDLDQTIALLKNGLGNLPDPVPASVPHTNPLTTRETEVLALLANGLSNREIADQLVFSLGTVKWYVNQIYSKLGVGSRTQAVVRARELNLLH